MPHPSSPRAGPLFAGSPFREQFVWVLRHVGVDRRLFGTDYPLDDPWHAIDAMVGLGFAPSELRRIFYSNSVEMFGLATSARGRPRSPLR